MLAPEAEPNPAHLKLAELEKAGKLKAVITQNIDGLHEKAGSKEVIDIHGSVLRNYSFASAIRNPQQMVFHISRRLWEKRGFQDVNTVVA